MKKKITATIGLIVSKFLVNMFGIVETKATGESKADVVGRSLLSIFVKHKQKAIQTLGGRKCGQARQDV